jgi:Bardet-Biedl syndrome 7 protein
MQEELKQQPAMIERLYALVTDLLIDRANFKGQSAHSRVPQLMELMDNCDLDSLIAFFHS